MAPAGIAPTLLVRGLLSDIVSEETVKVPHLGFRTQTRRRVRAQATWSPATTTTCSRRRLSTFLTTGRYEPWCRLTVRVGWHYPAPMPAEPVRMSFPADMCVTRFSGRHELTIEEGLGSGRIGELPNRSASPARRCTKSSATNGAQ